MTCTNRYRICRLLCIVFIAAIFVTGCGQEAATTYDSTTSALNPSLTNQQNIDYFSKDLCVTGTENYGLEEVHSEVAQGAGVFNLSTKEVTYAQNIHDRMYPASTTKILTAYIIIKYCDLNDTTIVSSYAATQAEDSSVCGLKEGDCLTIRDLLYGLILQSGNDAAIALAEYYSGSEEAFLAVMNQEALMLGATNSHFVNPNGLPDENHYTSVYDMYLIFQEAIRYPDFVELIGTLSYETTYTDKSGKDVNITWWNTNRYISGKTEPPEGITVVGGKTGTTYDAGYCLVLYSTNDNGEDIISIVFKADGKSNLYLLMNELLAEFA